MKNAGTFLTELQSGALNGRMIEIYGCDPDKAQGYADRFAKVIKGFQVTFPKNAQAQIGLYSAPGRTEIGGNHTDHQYGCVLAASVNLDAIAAAALNGTNVIRFYSEGYGMIEADLSVLEPVESEKESTLALIRGMAALAMKKGYDVKGIDVYCTSNVLGGSGLSSSAAFETLMGVILNDMFCGNVFDAHRFQEQPCRPDRCLCRHSERDEGSRLSLRQDSPARRHKGAAHREDRSHPQSLR